MLQLTHTEKKNVCPFFFFCIDLGELSSRDKTTEGVQFFLRFSGF